jgi:hypothetical protein
MPVSAKSRFEEGLNLPPIKIGENFELRNDFLEFYSVYGLRAPAMFISDLRARCTTADRVRVRLLELVEKRGADFVIGLLRKMCDTAQAGGHGVPGRARPGRGRRYLQPGDLAGSRQDRRAGHGRHRHHRPLP